ncbi:phosphatase PAP2 family protein [Ramlibacter albus]|uniref:Phosphatase PAP2 family protein n=1 Tax=Ramlibacter albus TaxID=2079448 RepID=A0A923M7X8_9BURK|nr:phosphatase PAP2 family protein [Ramlibacter albus]MBC5765040.1 phosphatase PAP2 family protein [Ramlibacter albus]
MSVPALSAGPTPAVRRVGAGTVLVACLALVIGWDVLGLDFAVAQWSGDESGFPLRHHWLLTTVLHDGARWLSWALALLLCVGAWRPAGPLARLPVAQRLQLAVSTLVAAAAVSLLKGFSVTSCPWDLQQFGGVAQYVSHWSQLADGGAGHCFPAGHASSGFVFVAGWFAFRDNDRSHAATWLAGSLAAGTLLGIAQQLRGAHFMSHTLWTAWICCATCWALDGLHRKFAVSEF